MPSRAKSSEATAIPPEREALGSPCMRTLTVSRGCPTTTVVSPYEAPATKGTRFSIMTTRVFLLLVRTCTSTYQQQKNPRRHDRKPGPLCRRSLVRADHGRRRTAPGHRQGPHAGTPERLPLRWNRRRLGALCPGGHRRSLPGRPPPLCGRRLYAIRPVWRLGGCQGKPRRTIPGIGWPQDAGNLRLAGHGCGGRRGIVEGPGGDPHRLFQDPAAGGALVEHPGGPGWDGRHAGPQHRLVHGVHGLHRRLQGIVPERVRPENHDDARRGAPLALLQGGHLRQPGLADLLARRRGQDAAAVGKLRPNQQHPRVAGRKLSERASLSGAGAGIGPVDDCQWEQHGGVRVRSDDAHPKIRSGAEGSGVMEWGYMEWGCNVM
mmetsp:Transcript_17426/g.40065  ORF Transcript_17426/g.40065 Transcript_17426/m.40065 type:complete len:377 (-) Transcript_17426:195-1325(-)